MNIAIDLSPLQNAHRMRGIGYTLINFFNNLPPVEASKHKYIFYLLPQENALFDNPLKLLNLQGLKYEVRILKPPKSIKRILPGRFNMPFGAINRLLRFHSFYFGDSRVDSLSGVDVFVQADQNFALPRGRGVKKVLILYDVIPYILEWDYLLSYRTARLRGYSRFKSLTIYLKRYLLSNKLKRNARRADNLIAISEHTKHDFVSHLSIPAENITVIPLGVSKPEISHKSPKLEQYIKTGWGYSKKPLSFDENTPYILFIGGVDSRRKLQDLVVAFNRLRAEGQNLKLVLAGDIMLGPSAITTPVIKDALRTSSYIEDVIFMGFIDDTTRDWLYSHALAFVFPSMYEGFGLPVLEAMIHKCLVISYKNQAVFEVARNAPIYTEGAAGLADTIKQLLVSDQVELDDIRTKGLEQAKKYNWSTTSASMLSLMTI